MLRLVVGRGLWLTALGSIVGVPLALALAQLVAGLLFNVTPHSPELLAGVVAIVAAASLAACVVPALQALRITPMSALRNE